MSRAHFEALIIISYATRQPREQQQQQQHTTTTTHNGKVGIDMQTIRADLKKRFEFSLEFAVESILSGNIVESLFNN